MRNVSRSLTTVLTAAAVVLVTTVLGRGVVAGQGAASPGSSSMSDRARFVGTYELVTTEIKDPSTGKWSPTPNFNSNGYIIYADTGHMGVHIQPKVRARFAANPPTGEEAQAALRGYAAYFGSFTVKDQEQEKFVVHHRFGQVNPGGERDAKRFYDFVTTPNGSQRLILIPAPADGGGKDKAMRRLVWQRMLDAPLSAEEKKFVGFWRLLYTDSYRIKDGKEVFHGDKIEARAGTSYIIYTSSGHMMVHLMNKEGRNEVRGRAADARRGAQGVSELQRLLRTVRGLREPESAVRLPQPAGRDDTRRVQRAEALLPVHGQRAEARRAAEPERQGRDGWRAPVLGAPACDRIVYKRVPKKLPSYLHGHSALSRASFRHSGGYREHGTSPERRGRYFCK